MMQAATAINGIAYSGAVTPAYTRRANDIRAYISTGFTPQNATFSTAGVGGTYIGAAVPVVPTPVFPTNLRFPNIKIDSFAYYSPYFF